MLLVAYCMRGCYLRIQSILSFCVVVHIYWLQSKYMKLMFVTLLYEIQNCSIMSVLFFISSDILCLFLVVSYCYLRYYKQSILLWQLPVFCHISRWLACATTLGVFLS